MTMNELVAETLARIAVRCTKSEFIKENVDLKKQLADSKKNHSDMVDEWRRTDEKLRRSVANANFYKTELKKLGWTNPWLAKMQMQGRGYRPTSLRDLHFNKKSPAVIFDYETTSIRGLHERRNTAVIFDEMCDPFGKREAETMKYIEESLREITKKAQIEIFYGTPNKPTSPDLADSFALMYATTQTKDKNMFTKMSEVYKAMEDGKKIRRNNWRPECFITMGKNNKIIDERGYETTITPSGYPLSDWELQKQKVLKYKFAYLTDHGRWEITSGEYKSVEDLQSRNGNSSFTEAERIDNSVIEVYE